MTRRRRPSGAHDADRSSQVYAKLRDLIVRGRLAPGARITETDAAGRLGVSRTPVRAALQQLAQEGYIVVANAGLRRRPVVAPLTREDATELLHIGQAVLAFGGSIDYFVQTVFNYPTLAECYKTAAFDGINRLG